MLIAKCSLPAHRIRQMKAEESKDTAKQMKIQIVLCLMGLLNYEGVYDFDIGVRTRVLC